VKIAFTIPKRIAASSRKSAGSRKPAYVSPSSTSATVVATGPATITTANISLTGPGVCTTAGDGDQACTISAGAPVGSVTFQITIYDANSYILSEGTTSAQTIAEGTNNVLIPVVLGAFVAAVSINSVSYASGSSFTEGTPNTATLYLNYQDADGNLVPVGAPLWSYISVSSSDPSITFTNTFPLTSVPASVGLNYSGATVPGGSVTFTAIGLLNSIPSNFPLAITSNPMVTTIAGTGLIGASNGPALSATFSNPYSLAIDSTGTMYIADKNNNIVRVLSGGTVSTLAGNGAYGFTNGPAASAEFDVPIGVAVSPDNQTVYIGDVQNNQIRSINSGIVGTFAGSTSQGLTNGPVGSSLFYNPNGVAVDAAGNIFVADSGNSVIRKISGGVVTTFAGTGAAGYMNGPSASAEFSSPVGVAVDASGNVYVADDGNQVIRKISGGVVSTLAGNSTFGYVDGPAASAEFRAPTGVAVDASGNVYVADSNNNVVRKIAGGMVTTYGGNGTAGLVNGPIATSQFNFPAGVAVDAAGNLYVADAGNNVIRKITP
jgi:sugar lactone lactonase YvrE